LVENDDHRRRGICTTIVDKLIYPLIPDVATQVAALRTGTIDLYHEVPIAQWAHLDKTTPEMLRNIYDRGAGAGIVFKCTEPPFDKKEVRQAMLVGTNMPAVADLLGIGPLPKYFWPISPSLPETIFTPFDKLPASSQLLFDYNPELAKQMLADAGYPDGLKIKLYVDTQAFNLDVAALLKDIWTSMGVEAEIKASDPTTHWDYMYDKTFTDCIFTTIFGGALNPADMSTILTGGHLNFGNWTNERYVELVSKAVVEIQEDVRNPLWKEAGLIRLDDAPAIPLYSMPEAVYWWPWIKNYYGEALTADTDYLHALTHAWLDQDLKAEMGY